MRTRMTTVTYPCSQANAILPTILVPSGDRTISYYNMPYYRDNMWRHGITWIMWCHVITWITCDVMLL